MVCRPRVSLRLVPSHSLLHPVHASRWLIKLQPKPPKQVLCRPRRVFKQRKQVLCRPRRVFKQRKLLPARPRLSQPPSPAPIVRLQLLLRDRFSLPWFKRPRSHLFRLSPQPAPCAAPRQSPLLVKWSLPSCKLHLPPPHPALLVNVLLALRLLPSLHHAP